uniref:PB1 domain-containing protein n=1 Tax=Oryza punctata TaxID=4537 RepID=A0A0E0MF55_ORYPU
MVGTSSWSSSSSCTSSLGSLDDDDVVACVIKQTNAAVEGCVKFLCSYGGRILPRHADGELRYVGGDNRVVSIDRSLPFHELQRKLREMCGWEAVCLRCQLPTEDLDALVSVTSDDDLANLLEEYDTASRDRLQPLKIRAFLFPRTTATTTTPLSCSPPPSASSPTESSTLPHAHCHHQTDSAPSCASRWAARQMSSPPARVLQQQQHYNRHGGEARSHRYLVQSASSRW